MTLIAVLAIILATLLLNDENHLTSNPVKLLLAISVLSLSAIILANIYGLVLGVVLLMALTSGLGVVTSLLVNKLSMA